MHFAVNSVFPSDELRQLPDMCSYGKGFGWLSDMRLLQRLYHDGDRLWMWVCITPTEIWYVRLIWRVRTKFDERFEKDKNDTKNNSQANWITIFIRFLFFLFQFNAGVLVGWNARMVAILHANVLADFEITFLIYIYIIRKGTEHKSLDDFQICRSLYGYTIFYVLGSINIVDNDLATSGPKACAVLILA